MDKILKYLAKNNLWTILLFLILILSGCVLTETTNESYLSKTALTTQKHQEYLCKRLINNKDVTPYCEDITNKFIRKENARVYFLSGMFDLKPGNKYLMIVDFYDPSGKLNASFGNGEPIIPKESTWYRWAWMRIDPDKDPERKTGIWTVKFSVNKKLVSQNKFIVADNNSEMAALESKLKEIDKNSIHSKFQEFPTIGKSWAVIIGISEYKYAGSNGLTNLVFADDDAKSFARVLHHLGWSKSHIKLLINKDATQRNLVIALKSWLTKAGPDDQVVLFWAGHGYPDPEDPEKVYLATYDTDINIPATGYRMDEVRKALEEIGAKNVFLFADTCHAGKLITRDNSNRGLSMVSKIKKQKMPKGWVFMVGADTDRSSVEDTSWANGAFTHSLIKGLNGAADGFDSIGPKDGIVTMGELRAYMNTFMPEETQKILGVAKRPVITTSTGDSDIWDLTLQIK